MPNPILKFAQGLFVPVVLGAFFYSFLSVCWPTPDPVSPRTWDEIQTKIKGKLRKTDLVIVHPAWEDSAGRYFKDNFLILGKPNNDSYKRYARIWVILTQDADFPSYLDDYKREQRFKVKGAEIHLMVRGGKSALYDFFANDPKLMVRMTDEKGERKTCPKAEPGKYVCPQADWHRVEDGYYNIEGKEQSCIKLHPRTGYVTEACYTDVPLGKRISGWIALTDGAVEFEEGTPVDFSVAVGDDVLKTIQAPNKRGRVPFSVDIPAGSPKKGTVTFSAKSKKDGKRHFCFVAAVEGEGQ